MITTRIVSSFVVVSFVLAPAAAIAEGSSSGSAVTTDVRTQVRLARCKKFAKGDDYERCVRLIQRIPAKETDRTDLVPAAEPAPADEDAWKWSNILQRLEDKIASSVKIVKVMAKSFCKDRSLQDGMDSRECMTRVKTELQTRVAKVIDTVFRADLPSSR